MLDSGPYRIVDRSAQAVEMASRDCPMTGLAITRRVTLLSQDAWTIHHRIRNNGTMSRFAGIWSVMMLNHPASIAVPAIRPAISPVFGCAGDLVRANDLGVIATCRERQEFKVAIPNPTGRVLIRCPDLETWVHTETPPPRSDDVFAHSLPFEIFNSGDYAYCEAEWHAPAARLAPGAETSFEQKFRIWRRRESPPDLALTTDERELMTCMS